MPKNNFRIKLSQSNLKKLDDIKKLMNIIEPNSNKKLIEAFIKEHWLPWDDTTLMNVSTINSWADKWVSNVSANLDIIKKCKDIKDILNTKFQSFVYSIFYKSQM